MRIKYLDNIRWMTVVLVVIYHVIYMFNSVVTAGVIGPITQGTQYQDILQYVLYPWFMVLLFMVSGVSARCALQKQTDKEFLRSRTTKLLVPSTIGLLVFQWIQGWVNMSIGGAFTQMADSIPKPILYLIMCVSGTGVLWYIQLLWFFSLLLLLARKLEKGKLDGICKRTNMVALLVMTLFAWGFAQILNTPIIVVYRFGIYGFYFFVGYFVMAHEEVTEKLKKHAIWLAVAAVLLCVAYTYLSLGEKYPEAPNVNSPLACAYGWIASLAIMGGMKRWGDFSNAFTDWMARKSFGLYVFHYLPLSAVALLLTRATTLPPVIIYLLTGIAAFLGAYLLFEIVSRIPFFRWAVLGIKKKKD